VQEGRFALSDLRTSDEAFTSSSIRELMPVVEVDGEQIPRGQASEELQAALRTAALG
jgi:branched-subunit amino acid aminotransferase/4-amino-4-deoxychorismate lyase